MTEYAAPLPEITASATLDEHGYLLATTAQQAILPRPLSEGVYAIRAADGAIQIAETPGYQQLRELTWAQARASTPEFVHRDVTLGDIGSFAGYVARNCDPGTGAYNHDTGELEVWADVSGRRMIAILDGYDGLRKHTASLALAISPEWAEWAARDGNLYPQDEFAEFITDHVSTIAEPDGAALVDMCETLTGTVGVKWRSQSLDRSGQRQFVYEEQVEGRAGVKGSLPIPTELHLVLRPFVGGDPVAMTARFRFRVRDGGLALGVKLVERSRVLEAAFASATAEVQGLVPVPIFDGRPA